MSKKFCFRATFDKQHGKCAQARFKSALHYLYHIHWSLRSELGWKKSPLLTQKIFRLLINTWPAEKKYPLFNRDNLMVPIQLQLSQKQKTFFEFCAALFKSGLNFNHFEKKESRHRFCIFDVTDTKNVVR